MNSLFLIILPFEKSHTQHILANFLKLTLRAWVNKIEVDTGKKAGVTSDSAAKIKELERENKELKQANEILKKAAAFFAQAELDRKPQK